MIVERHYATRRTVAVALWRSNETTLLHPAHDLDIDYGWAVAAQRKELYDEPHIWMDERWDGRGDMDLDGGRRTGSGPAGRRD